MIAAIHQPNYLPWIGYFTKIAMCDTFIFHDYAPFSKRAVTKRTRIRKAKADLEARWLTVPVVKYASGTSISDIRISDEADWVSDHLRAIQNTYLSAPYFAAVYPVISDILRSGSISESLSELNWRGVVAIAERLGLSCTYKFASELIEHTSLVDKSPEEHSPHKLNMELLNAVGASAYVSGVGARAYQEDVHFDKASIRLVYQDIGAWLESHPYDQGVDGFAGGLSIIDPLMHLGFEGTRALMLQYIDSELSELLLDP